MFLERFRRALLAAAIVVALVVPLTWYIRVPRQWERSRFFRVTGDEPHYLITADAIVHDHGLTVAAAYERDRFSGRIFGPIDSWKHTRSRPRGVFSIHGIGLSVLVAPGFSWSGVHGARLTLELVAGLIPFLFFWIARLFTISRWESVVLAVCASFSLPFLAAAGQIFPDLPTGVALLALASLALAASVRPLPSAVLFLAGCVAGVLPWFHIKNAAPTAILCCTLLLFEIRRFGAGQLTRRLATFLTPTLVGVMSLAAYNVQALGGILGAYQMSEAAGATTRQALMILFGLHLDQAQGIFLQQPLFLLALPGVGLLFRRSPIIACSLVATYIAVVVPNAFHPCWYGCTSFSGRFMWSAAGLWFFPLAALYSGLGRRARITVCSLAGCAVVWQIHLMHIWRSSPGFLYTSFVTSLSERNSLFSGPWRRALPSFYDFDRYLARVPNLAAIVVVGALLGVGVLCAVMLRRGLIESGPTRFQWGRYGAALITSTVGVLLLAGAGILALRLVRPADIDLIQQFREAEKRPRSAGAETFGVKDVTIGIDTKRVIYAYPPTRLTWYITVPEEAELDTAIALEPSAWDSEGNGVVFRIGVGYDRAYEELLNVRLNPSSSIGDRPWRPVHLDLSRYGGKRVALVLTTDVSVPGEAPDQRGDYSCWGAPVVRPF